MFNFDTILIPRHFHRLVFCVQTSRKSLPMKFEQAQISRKPSQALAQVDSETRHMQKLKTCDDLRSHFIRALDREYWVTMNKEVK